MTVNNLNILKRCITRNTTKKRKKKTKVESYGQSAFRITVTTGLDEKYTSAPK